jgi:hypothetical protein
MTEICPCCSRELKSFIDFPFLCLTKVSIIKPEEVSEQVPFDVKEDLLEASHPSWERELLPTEVFEYFVEHPGKEELVHSDGFIYYIPNEEKESIKTRYPNEKREVGQAILWYRSKNYAPLIKDFLENNHLFHHYLNGLEGLVGTEVPTGLIMPNWVNTKKRPVNYFPIKGHEDLELRFEGDKKGIIDVSLILGRGDYRNIFDIGSIEYEGRLNLEPLN